MAEVISSIVLLEFDEQTSSAVDALRALQSILLASSHASDAFNRIFPHSSMALDDILDCLVAEPPDPITNWAAVLEGFQIRPSDRFLKLVGAVCGDDDTYSVRVAHGWPILSIGDRTPIVTEAGAANNRVGGGLS